MTEQIEETPTTPDEIIAPPDAWYRMKHMVFSIVMIGLGFWFAYDGYIGWPGHNQRVHDVKVGIEQAQAKGENPKELKEELSKMREAYTETDILIQKLLAFSLPFAGLAYGIWTYRATRGRYRLAGHTLEIPGHNPIEMVDIQRIDKTRWDRKGIAVVAYMAHHPRRERSFKLDDFAYQRKPTDEIVDRIDAFLAPPAEMPTEPVAPSNE